MRMVGYIARMVASREVGWNGDLLLSNFVELMLATFGARVEGEVMSFLFVDRLEAAEAIGALQYE